MHAKLIPHVLDDMAGNDYFRWQKHVEERAPDEIHRTSPDGLAVTSDQCILKNLVAASGDSVLVIGEKLGHNCDRQGQGSGDAPA